MILVPSSRSTTPLTGGEFPAHARAVNAGSRPRTGGLLTRTLGEICAADAFRKAEIVLDLRAGAGLAADGEAFDQDSLQAFRRAINGGA